MEAREIVSRSSVIYWWNSANGES